MRRILERLVRKGDSPTKTVYIVLEHAQGTDSGWEGDEILGVYVEKDHAREAVERLPDLQKETITWDDDKTQEFISIVRGCMYRLYIEEHEISRNDEAEG